MKTNIIEVSQFFDWTGMSWQDLYETKEKGVCPSLDKTAFLWIEKPVIKEVEDFETPSIGEVWLKEKEDGGLEVYKANYDSSD